ncbi:MAG: release factor glutamine methyltransferase [Anaerolineaceae bacterium]|nr:MAG: release factor glutamine methyltransferase [Anaerolineaceae bacterium]
MMDATVQSALDSLAERLRARSDTPELDAQVLLANVLRKPRSWLAAHPEARLDPEPAAALEASARRVEGGEPLPYVLGEWEFFGLAFAVTPDVLIPRPETELLVERALSWMRQRLTLKRQAGMAKSAEADSPLRVLDVGTGSGCIAIALAANAPEARVTATDISPAALTVARRNAERLGVANRVTFLEADLFPNPLLPDPYSLIVANLPYIPTATLHGLPIFGREPALALDGGADGLALIRRLLAKAPEALAPGGMMLLEIEAAEGPAVLALARAAFSGARIDLHQDLAGRDRLLEIQV